MLALLLTSPFTVAASERDPSPATKALIEADWEQQERVSRKLSCEDAAALEGVLERGRLMVSDMRRLGAEAKAEQTEKLLKEIAEKLQT